MYRLGRNISVHLFGSSHGPCVGCIIEGLPKGTVISADRIAIEMELRKPKEGIGTPRKEKDIVEITGDINGKTIGSPVTMTIRNENTHGRSYSQFKDKPRPGHADLPALMRFRDFDIRGGGQFSGRLTAPLVAAGAVMKDLLRSKGIEINAFARSIGSVEDPEKNVSDVQLTDTRARTPALDEKMKKEILKASEDGDSVGGVVECIVTGLPIGFGGIWFEGLDSEIASAIFSIPAVKGIEFGKGFELSKMKGSESNDPYTIVNNKIVAEKNDMGGIVGGMSNGMPVVFKVAFKPTPSIAKEQSTVDLKTMTQTSIKIEGRHDPCIVPRAVSVVEAVTAIVIADQAKEAGLFDQ
jgi:chorismate synthase